MNKVFWSDFHTNLHSKHVEEIEDWYNFAREMIDFWSPCYYPYIIKNLDNGFHLEAEQPKEIWEKDFKTIKKYLEKKEKQDGYISYASYEWQGAGLDGDHNVFYRDFSQKMFMPRRYLELRDQVKIGDTVAIPHHTAYSPGHRGKNWDTNDERLSTVMEIYSSHGCSESDQVSIPLNVHIHMGPREDKGSAMNGLNVKHQKIGLMCSGDNHVIPAISGNGLMGVVCPEYDKDKIFDAILNRHVYGVTRSKILLDYKINDTLMGSELTKNGKLEAKVNVRGTNAIDRVEFIQNGVPVYTYVHSGQYERKRLEGKIKAKFELELGWGPDVRVFEDIQTKLWDVKIKTDFDILDVEKLYTSSGSKIHKEEKNEFEATVKTSKEGTGNGKLSQKNYLTPYIRNQSYIFEVEGNLDDKIYLEVDNNSYEYTLRQLLEQTQLNALYKEIKELIKKRYGVEDYYRSDPFWHNAYKFKIHKACPEIGYDIEVKTEIQKLEDTDNVMVKIHQKNGEVAWSSPIWIN